ncbi:phosphomannomutase/phosphoglucomutase [Patescibacteria group bacterium]|nr:phosphomannomutase/phosphoglucomutase [Patescibacteria group bacterium]MBU1123438.1 phosphomannomutase/phosphoglucomutase [Patescibacteria group bacterium]MBU1910889.1 phosphomannomutase/phosphoglucomutase [Patescibacteria group bacterium]
MMIDPHIFRAYDIRGIVPDQVNEELALLIGKGFGSIMRERTGKEHPQIAVGRDMRPHSPGLEKAIIKGLNSTGCNVVAIGQTPSPLNYFAICTNNLDGSIQVTASHNEAIKNGFKLQVHDAIAFASEDIQILLKRIQNEEFIAGEGEIEELNVIDPYIEYLTEKFAGIGEGMKIIVDYGNGVAGPVYSKVLNNIGCELITLYEEPDGNFPNHIADPSNYETLKDLQKRVEEEKADIGFGIDGDGDRVGIVDENGNIRTTDEALLMLAKDHIGRNPGASVIFTVSCSGVLESEIEKWGGKPIMCEVGHSIVENAMHKFNSKLGGEQSGHFFLGEGYFGYDDAFFAALQMLKILSESGKTLSQLLSEFPKVYQVPEIRPDCSDEHKTRIVSEATEYFKKDYPVNDLDGARIDFGNGAWAGIRQSNTSPRLSICIEARSEEKMEEVKGIVLEYLRGFEEVEF